MDAWFASRWHDDNLARGAFDARLALAGGSGNKLDADSPSVDAGSKDWLSGGTTSTENEILEGVAIPDGDYKSDNPPPKMLGDFDNQNASGDVKSWEDEDSNTYGTKDELDMGYHYWGIGYHWVTGVGYPITYDLDEMEIPVTLRHPKHAFGKFEYYVYDDDYEFYPYVDDDLSYDFQKLAVSSNIYNQKEETIACFSATHSGTINNQQYMMLCYHRFREDSMAFDPMIDMFVSYTDPVTSGWFTPYLGAVDLATEENQPTYLAALIIWFDQYLFTRYEIDIYRYQPDDEEEKWHKIAQKEAELDNSGLTLQYFDDVALAVDGNDLLGFWTMMDDESDSYL
jgi:hypothetical protein